MKVNRFLEALKEYYSYHIDAMWFWRQSVFYVDDDGKKHNTFDHLLLDEEYCFRGPVEAFCNYAKQYDCWDIHIEWDLEKLIIDVKNKRIIAIVVEDIDNEMDLDYISDDYYAIKTTLGDAIHEMYQQKIWRDFENSPQHKLFCQAMKLAYDDPQKLRKDEWAKIKQEMESLGMK